MMREKLLVVMFVVGIVAGPMWGCGLVSSDIATIKFDLPERTYTFDTTPFNFPMGNLPSVPCSPSMDCCTAAAGVGYNCATQPPLSCSSGTCSVSKTIENPPMMVNLMTDSTLGSQSVADISISQITYDVTSTLNVELPSVGLFLAPVGVTVTTDPMAMRFVKLPPIAAGTVMTYNIVPDSAGNAAFTAYAHNPATPFNFLSSTTVTVAGGSPFPMGKVDIKVRGQLAAKPSL